MNGRLLFQKSTDRIIGVNGTRYLQDTVLQLCAHGKVLAYQDVRDKVFRVVGHRTQLAMPSPMDADAVAGECGGQGWQIWTIER